jgi:hypothetical protein
VRACGNGQDRAMKRKKRRKSPHNISPILFIQWLNLDDPKEAYDVWEKFQKKVEIRFVDVHTRDEAVAAIRHWLHRNPNAQFLYFSTHGDTRGLGPAKSNGIDWPELWDVLTEAVKRRHPVSLWLGACESSYSADAWSPVPDRAPVEYVVGFPTEVPTEVDPDEIGKVLNRLIKMTRLDPVTYVDEEIRKLRLSVRATSVLMHYKAKTKAGEMRYVNFATFREEVGMTLKRYLELKSSKKGRGL